MKNALNYKTILRTATAMRSMAVIALIAVIGFTMVSCGGDDETTDEDSSVTGGTSGTGGTGGTGGGNNVTYALGDTGPGGGKIFYYSAEGFTLYTSRTDTKGTTAHYLEAAPEDMSKALAWTSKSNTSITVPGTGTAIGTGRKNTSLIENYDSMAPAAIACRDLVTPVGLHDWFLPSKDELNMLYENRSYVGNMGEGNYWSSTQVLPNTYVWRQRFSDGIQYSDSHSGGGSGNYYIAPPSLSVRAVRAF